ncbi:MAG: GspE/PulE/PilB domain-containing protein [Planctomycetota bacterium]
MSDLDRITKKPLGRLLIDEGIVTPDQVDQALIEQERTGELLGEALVKAGYTTETEIVRTLCEQFGKPFCKASLYDVAKETLALLPARLLVENCFVPLDRFGNVLIIAMGGLLDAATIAQMRKLSGCDIEVYISPPSDCRTVLRKLFPDMYDPITMLPIRTEEAYTTSFRLEMTEEEEDDMGGTTREVEGVAEEDSDWEALFEEAEQNVLKELKGKK